MNDAFLAKHPQWAGWQKGMPLPQIKPKSPAAKTAAAAAVSSGATPIVGGKPVMSGDVVKDVVALLAWHGYQKSDMDVYKRFQQSVGLKTDGTPGSQTMAALASAAANKGIQMPNIAPFVAWPGSPAGPKPDVNV